MEKELTLWIARDDDDRLCLYYHKPIKQDDTWGFSSEMEHSWNTYTNFLDLPGNLFPNVTWKDKEPVKINMGVDINKVLDTVELFYGKLPNREEIIKHYVDSQKSEL